MAHPATVDEPISQLVSAGSSLLLVTTVARLVTSLLCAYSLEGTRRLTNQAMNWTNMEAISMSNNNSSKLVTSDTSMKGIQGRKESFDQNGKYNLRPAGSKVNVMNGEKEAVTIMSHAKWIAIFTDF